MAAEMNLWTRLSAESPKFFNRIIKFAIALSATATAVLVALGTIPNFTLPEWVSKACQYAVVAGVVAGAVAKTTMTDKAVDEANKEKVEKAIEKAEIITFEKPAAPNDKSV